MSWLSALVTLPPGRMPQLISDTPKVASSAAMARSQEAMGVKAPPKHQPFTMAMVGLAKFMSFCPCQANASRRARTWTMRGLSSVSRKYSLRSMPAEKESPEPVSTSTPQRSSTSRASSTSFISRFMTGFMALRLSGRFMETQAMPSSSSTRTALPHGSFSPPLASALPLPASVMLAPLARSPGGRSHSLSLSCLNLGGVHNLAAELALPPDDSCPFGLSIWLVNLDDDGDGGLIMSGEHRR